MLSPQQPDGGKVEPHRPFSRSEETTLTMCRVPGIATPI
jgi:hypothetical protein